MSSLECSPDRADIGQDGEFIEADQKTANVGRDGKSRWGEYKIPKKREKFTDYKDRYDESHDESESDPYEYEDDLLDDDSDVPESNDNRSYRSRAHESDENSDDDGESKRFDPMCDESEFILDKSKAKYAKKYFKLHLSEEKIRSRVLEDAPIPANGFLNPPDIDDYIEDLVADHKSMRFLKMHDSSLKFVQKRVSQCMGPLSRIWEELDEAHRGNTSKMEIGEVVELLEKTLLMVGQVNVACLFERRLNFLVKIVKSTKKAKVMLRDSENQLQDEKTLFGNDFYSVLDRKAKNRKRAREMSREMTNKKARTDQPFRRRPSGNQSRGGTGGSSSRGSSSSRGRGRGGRKTRPNHDQRYGKYSKGKHTNCFRAGLESKNGSLQSPHRSSKFENVGHSSKSHSSRGKVKTFCGKLGKNYKRRYNFGGHKGLPNRLCRKSRSTVCTKNRVFHSIK